MKPSIRRIGKLLLCSVAALLPACAEPVHDATETSLLEGSFTAVTLPEAPSRPPAAVLPAAPLGEVAGLVMNELAVEGTGWIEIYNPNDEPVDVSGHAVSDSAKDGSVHLEHLVHVPPGTTVPPHGYFLVLTDQVSSGMTTGCMGAEVAECLAVTWKLSVKSGETAWWLDASGRVVASAHLPAGGPPAGTSLCVLENVEPAAFGQCVPSPGARNTPVQ